MIVAVWRGLNHEGKSVASSHCIFGFCYGCMLPGSINFHSSWINWVCRSISLLLTEISVNVQHCYHHPSYLLLLYGLREKGKKKKFCHWLMDYDVFCFRHVSFFISSRRWTIKNEVLYMRVQIIRIMMVLSLLLVVSACSNEKEA